jgi:excinuclease ABC subunit C
MLPHTPDVIECLDITNLQGRDAYGSLVTFVTGEPDKNRCRLYKIQTIDTPDDYTMMREVLLRRFRPPRMEELGRETVRREPPDLLLIDGGKGQLNIAKRVLDELGIANVPLAAIAKGESKGRATDDIYLVGRKNPLKFTRGAKELLLLMRIRDEAHRFGIAAHRKKRTRELTPTKRKTG